MTLQTKNWALASATINTWTDVVAEPATIAALTLTASASATVDIRVSSGGSNVAMIVTGLAMITNDNLALDLRSLNLTGTQHLQIRTTVNVVQAFASGVVPV